MSKATLFFPKPGKRPVELGLVELRPQNVSEPQLCIRQVPQQEIADPLLTTGTNQEIRIRDAAQLHFARKRLFTDICRLNLTRPDPCRQRPCGIGNIPTPAVRDGDVQHEPCVFRSSLLGFGNTLVQPLAELLPRADKPQLYIITMQVTDLTSQCLDKKTHEA